MKQSTFKLHIRLSAVALSIAGILFFLYPAIRPFSDETSLQGARAFASSAWLLAHMLAMVAFTLLPLGLYGLHSSLKETPAERLGYLAFNLSVLGIGLTLPFYGGEAYGLHTVGQEAIRQQSSALLNLAPIIRSGAGLYMFLIGLLLLAFTSIITAVAIWKSVKYQKWSGFPFAIGFVLYIPQFFGTQSLRVAHGLLITIGCLWIAVNLLRRNPVGRSGAA